MGYGKYWNFERVISKAQAWTSKKAYHLAEHFVEITGILPNEYDEIEHISELYDGEFLSVNQIELQDW